MYFTVQLFPAVSAGDEGEPLTTAVQPGSKHVTMKLNEIAIVNE